MSDYDLVIKDGNVVIPYLEVRKADIGIIGERIAAVADSIPTEGAGQVIDATDKFVFPGAVDSHFHIGIYRPYKDDAISETTSAASGGVTTLLSYFRTTLARFVA